MSVDYGERLKSVRKRAGLSQTELAEASGISLSQIRKIEQGEYVPRLETLRRLAAAMRVRTSTLQAGSDAEYADAATEDLWTEVRRALAGQYEQPDEEPTAAGVTAAADAARPMMGTHEYQSLAQLMPTLIRDADALDAEEGRAIRARILGMTGWLLVQNRQFDTAHDTLTRAIDQADDPLTAASAANTMIWGLVRQGRLVEGQQMAQSWADRIEPRFSRATARELSLWGRLYLYVGNCAVRDNSPGAAADALSLARAAAHRIGREVLDSDQNLRTFGPVTVAHNACETHVIADEPDRALAVAERTPLPALQPGGAGRLRHRLDVAAAHTRMGDQGSAFATLAGLREIAPEWLAQQRYARDILGSIVSERRTLTDEMRAMADDIRLEY